MEIRRLSALAACSLCAQPATRPIVDFVCEHGAAKSVIAAAELKRMASSQRGLDIEAVSRGTAPDAILAQPVVAGLRAVGLAAHSPMPVKLSAIDLMATARVVTFGPDLAPWLPPGSPRPADWSATPSPGQNHRAARDHIRKLLLPLLDDLGRP